MLIQLLCSQTLNCLGENVTIDWKYKRCYQMEFTNQRLEMRLECCSHRRRAHAVHRKTYNYVLLLTFYSLPVT